MAYFKESLMGAVVDSTEKIKVKGYIIYTKLKVSDLKDIILVKKANPIVKGEKKKSKTFKVTEDETLDKFNDKIFKLYLSVDFFIFNGILYTFNLSFQEIFNIEKTLKNLKENAIKEILSKEYFDNNRNKFRNNLQSNIPLQMYMNFDIEKIIVLDRLDVRKDIASVEPKAEGEEKFTSITIEGENITDKKLAGERLLEAISKVKINESKVIGKYRNMDLEVSYNFFTNEHNFRLNGVAKHSGELGISADCNITRLDNALEKMPEKLNRLEEKLISTKEQLENAKEELKKPFEKVDELKSKVLRLAELNKILDMGEVEEMISPL